MMVRRVFWNHHIISDGKVIKMVEDFDEKVSHDEAAIILRDRHGYPPTTMAMNYRNFAEVISSSLTEKDRVVEPGFTTPKHLGTDCLFSGKAWAEMQPKAPTKKLKNIKIV